MPTSQETTIVDGITFELAPHRKNPTHSDWVCLRKCRKLVDSNLTLAPEFQGCNMVEVGVDHGGGTAFFHTLLKPRGLLAIELSDEPVTSLLEFLSQHDKQRTVRVCWGVNQSDTVAMPRCVNEKFGAHDLDFVVDDASHMLAETTTTFETLFPRLRENGAYIIEDWSTDHLYEAHLERLLIDEPENSDLQNVQRYAATDGAKHVRPVGILICQLLIAAARRSTWVESINAYDGFCIVRRGSAEIQPGTPMSEYVGELGELMFKNSVV